MRVLPTEVANDRERRERFEFEAHAVAALNLPTLLRYSLWAGIRYGR